METMFKIRRGRSHSHAVKPGNGHRQAKSGRARLRRDAWRSATGIHQNRLLLGQSLPEKSEGTSGDTPAPS
jgi:hypothetical protein